MLSRRSVLAALAASPAFAVLPAAAEGSDANPEELAAPGPLEDISLGSPTAPVKVYEYASMTCPHCARFEKDVFPKIKQKYIDTGKVLWTLREFPLDPRAAGAFMLARCAGRDKYYAMIDVYFAQQENWAFDDPSKTLASMAQIAKQAGFTQDQFDKCLKDKALYDGVMAIKKRGSERFKIDGTPTFFINGKRLSGEITMDDFEKAIAPMLKS